MGTKGRDILSMWAHVEEQIHAYLANAVLKRVGLLRTTDRGECSVSELTWTVQAYAGVNLSCAWAWLVGAMDRSVEAESTLL